MKIIAYLKESWSSLLLVVLLLLVQVQCDLAVPKYTSSLVDVGITQKGVADCVPEKLSGKTLADLTLFMDDNSAGTLCAAYGVDNPNAFSATDVFELQGFGEEDVLNRVLSYIGLKDDETAQKREELSDIVCIPLAILYAGVIANNLPEETPEAMRAKITQFADSFNVDDIRAEVAANRAKKFEVLAGISAVKDSMDELTKMQMNTFAIGRVQAEYTLLKVDQDKIQTDYLYQTGGMMLLFSLAGIVCAVLVVLLASRAAAGIARNLRARMFRRVLSFSRAEMDKFSPASLVTRSTNDIQHIQMALVMLIRVALYSPMLGAGAVWNVMQTKTGLGWLLGVAIGTILSILIVVNFTVLPKFRIMQNLLDRLNLVSREILTGLPVIRAFGRERNEEQRFDTASRSLLKNQLFVNRAMSMLMPLFFFFMNALTVAIVWFSAQGIDRGTMRLGDMLAFITYTMQIVMSFMMLAMIFVFLPRAEVAAGRVNEVLRTNPTVLDPPSPQDDMISDWRGELAFEDVSFRFPGAEENVLEGISFVAEPGKTTAILGGTGSGKSTLVQLIPRLYDVTAGRVTIDGVDVRDISKNKLRSLVGYVPQKAVLFSGTIDSNLRFGSQTVQSDDVFRAAQIAQAEDFILEKEHQYASEIAQGGTNVSGGQRQRLAIARAIAKKPKALVFDDSFSALDFKTDAALRHALHTQLTDATLIIVAQRIATVLHADQIIVLDEGRVVGRGTHEELIKSCTAYQEIARSQLSDEELAKGGVSNG
ncbi:MAG: ABC transporter ATP-binding protein/permease [Clostridium sp.]|nr:ABC transporter ATP-binding protein/permease [Clostridium sp.]